MSNTTDHLIPLTGDYTLNIERRVIVDNDGSVATRLTRAQSGALRTLVEHRGRLVTRADLLVPHVGPPKTTETVRPLICRLRERLSAIPGAKQWIETVTDSGYAFVAEITGEQQ